MNDPVSRQREHFNALASRYSEARSTQNHLELKRLLWSCFLTPKRELLGDTLTVLEAMCGTADGYELLTEHLSSSVDYNGFDLSEAMIERARARHRGVNIWKADVTAFEPSRTYDLLLILGGLHHVPHLAREVVASLSAAIRPGGFFLSWEPTHDNIVFRRVRESIYRRNSVFEATSERAFRTSELFSMFEESGFTLVDAMYPGLLSYVLYYNPDAFPKLNLGSPKTVRTLWKLERPFMRSWLARKLSFATLTLWQKRASSAR